jgi:transposase
MMVVLGTDAHEKTHTIVACDEVGAELGSVTVGATSEGHLQAVKWAARWEQRRWAIEDCRHISRRLEADLLAAGELVVRVPPKMMAGQRRSARTRGKSDPIDALAVARAALREPDLPVAQLDGPAREVKLLVDYREALIRERTALQNRLRWRLHELPVCAGLTGAKLVGEAADITRFSTRDAYALFAGTAPIPVWTGNPTRFRLNRGGNRQTNAALHRIAVTQIRMHPPAQDLMARHMSNGKTKREALRILKRRLADVVYRTMIKDTQALQAAPAKAA